MQPKTFFRITGFIFLIITVLHALRLIYGWQIVIGTLTIPLWISWLALIIAGLLSYTGLRLSRRS